MTFYDQKTMSLLHTKNNLAVPAVMKTSSLGDSNLVSGVSITTASEYIVLSLRT